VPSTVPTKPIRRFERSQSVRRDDFGKFGPSMKKRQEMKADPPQPSNATYMNFNQASSSLPPVLEEEDEDEFEIDAEMIPQQSNPYLHLLHNKGFFFFLLLFYFLFHHNNQKPFLFETLLVL